MFNTYYQQELSYLRELGKDFAAANPSTADKLGTIGDDPDVERLLEGVAFLTGRIRQKADDELPELFQALMGLLWPHYLRPVPSTAILQYRPVMEQLTGVVTVPGLNSPLVRRDPENHHPADFESIPVDGTACRFVAAYDVELAPIELVSAELEQPMAADAQLRLVLRAAGKADLGKLNLSRVRFFLADEPLRAAALYLWLLRYARRVELREPASGHAVTLHADCIRAGGFTPEESLLPYPRHAFAGYRLLQEYFTCPAKFHFVDFLGLEALARLGAKERFELIVPFSRRPEETLTVDQNSMRLFCTPIVNLFPHSADGMRVDHTRTEYLLRPATSGGPPEHYEIFSIDRVLGLAQGTAARREYPPLNAIQHGVGAGPSPIYYQTRLYDAVVGDGTDMYISFVGADQRSAQPPTETISVELTCSNRNLGSRLKARDVRIAGTHAPEFTRFENITAVSRSLRPPLGKGLHWRLISHLSLNYLSLQSVEALRGILELYNYPALYDRQAARENTLRLEGITALECRPAERILRGAPVRGLSIHLELKEDNFAGEGEMYLLATVLNEFFALYTTINSFTELHVRGAKFGEVYHWPPRLGRQALL